MSKTNINNKILIENLKKEKMRLEEMFICISI